MLQALQAQQKFERRVKALKKENLTDLDVAKKLKAMMFKNGKFRFLNTIRYIFKVGALVALLVKTEAPT